ncbi:translation initiation factor IF-2 N-terminal domain-containing protein [Nakamurella aerolata]|uniref:Ribonuclease E n=1 Tax=Nakamurella aerolata TaxID=1656892 RepID=A0A849A7N5_9ACTN|nr:translation initiation factor IF-2 N-terminal domain-containing protein [Nakamurella aerolata]NNG36559.1 Rne/Rng family ribonuclease [Nakamurella aerolata]
MTDQNANDTAGASGAETHDAAGETPRTGEAATTQPAAGARRRSSGNRRRTTGTSGSASTGSAGSPTTGSTNTGSPNTVAEPEPDDSATGEAAGTSATDKPRRGAKKRSANSAGRQTPAADTVPGSAPEGAPEAAPAGNSAADPAADLPARPRVHELAKRTGLSSKELISALADRGVTVKAANSTVDRAVALELIAELTPSGSAGLGAAVPAAQQAAQDADAPDTDTDTGTDTAARGAGTSPMFLEPAPASAASRSRRRRAAAASEVEPADTSAAGSVDDAAAEDAGTADGGTAADDAKPTGRRGRGRRGKKAADPDQADASAETPDSSATDASGSGDQSTGTDSASTADSAGDEGDSSDGRRRRRRGRRGRGRAADESGETDAADGQQDAAAADSESRSDSGQDTGSSDREPSDKGRRSGGRDAGDKDGRDARDAKDAAQADTGADPADADNDDSDDETDGTGSGSRRRRRRRRRGGGSGDDAGAANGSDSRRDNGGDTSGSDDEVQGIKGSTRLEAKRQRRRDSRESSRRPHILSEAEFLARRESVNRVMAVRQRAGLAQVALLEDDVLVEHFVSQAGSESMIGNIYLGKVQNVLPSMEAAFIDIGRGRNAVLYAGEVNWDATGLSGKARRIETALNSGDIVLVQVSKDPVGHKGARLTTQISLPGRFLVYVPGGGATGISRKLPDTERKRLKKILDKIVPDDAGVIIRTAAEGVPESELASDVERLKNQWEQIKQAADGGSKASAPQQLSAEPDTLIKVVRDLFNSDIAALVIDGDSAYQAVSGYVQQVAPELADRVSKFDPEQAPAPAKTGKRGRGKKSDAAKNNGAVDVFTAYRIDEQIAKALERKVHLPSGGSLVIDRTEAMTVIDVNTGKYTGSGGNLEETVTKNNLEAAEEIVRQLRLRDIGGIIVVDFIDMVLESNRDLVLRRLTECLGRDRTRHQVAEVTSLGLVQMTRKRMGTGLVEAFSQPCEHCHGRGIVLLDAPEDHDHEPAGDNKPGKKRRERRNTKADRGNADASSSAETDDVEPLRITSVRADPRGPKPPLRPGAPVRTLDELPTLEEAAAVTAAGAGSTSAEAPDDPAVISERLTEASEQVSDPAEVSAEVREVVAAVTGASTAAAAGNTAGEHRAAENGTVQNGTVEGGAVANGAADNAARDSNAVGDNAAAPRPKRRRRAATRAAGPADPVHASSTAGSTD